MPYTTGGNAQSLQRRARVQCNLQT
jgi:hypothetical protein